MAETTAPTATPSAEATTAAPDAKPVESKPIVIGGISFRDEASAKAEIERGRQSGKLLTEAQKRLFEASKKEKDWDSFVGEIKTKKDAKRLVERLGLSKEEAVELFGRYVYNEEVLPKELDPKERRIRELEAEAAQRKEKEDADAKLAKDRELEENTKREESRLKDELTKLLADKKVPSTRLALRRLANYLASYAEAGADIPADRAADMVMDDYKQEFGELFEEASPDQLAEFFGPQKWQMLAKKVSEWALARARGGGNIPSQKTAVPPRTSKPPPEPSDKMSPQEFQAFLRRVK